MSNKEKQRQLHDEIQKKQEQIKNMKQEEARIQKEMRRKAIEQKQAILDQENEIN